VLPTLALMNYYAMIHARDHKYSTRLSLVLHARTHGIHAAARALGCSRNTVRLWLRRFEQAGRSGLQERSRAPGSCPHKTSRACERQTLAARAALPCAGPRRLKDLFGLKASQGAIARILRAHGLTRRRKKARQRKRDLRAMKAAYRPFERLQADTKPLYDIPAYWPQMMAHGLPRHQYTLRDVKSGALFIDYANELSTTYATLATARILDHLTGGGIALKASILSTDNGSEYGGQDKHERTRGFHAKIGWRLQEHRFLPPATPNAHADVESSHALIEHELFDLEIFRSRLEFFNKIRAYQRWFNFARPNYSKGGKTPAQMLQAEGFDPRILLLDPLDLDLHFRLRKISPGVGQDVPALPGSSSPKGIEKPY
jgi:transposase